ncbi:DJ-1/PfpI family protein [Leptospira sp. GIMC2001]|uniref:DJ-1/PfpI family protein n=1 Tax=Leptospira sp. GIMC2001 TaxID=1513297 RepID=UPI00234B0EBA|nr:DJ-1/PfpI family protein [Leptospira sp. GIMC2001]WCL47772.1 DJ-1/PfpI family protein [Leptospira sp. GIMC2001]
MLNRIKVLVKGIGFLIFNWNSKYEAQESSPQPGLILIVMSAANNLLIDEERNYETGVFLNELYLPIAELKNQGYKFQFATPNGKQANIDPAGLNDRYWTSNELKSEAIEFTKTDPDFLKPITLEKAMSQVSSYKGMIVPGGQGLMVDLIYDDNILSLLRKFHERQKPIGLICHAPALLTAFPKNDNPFVGYNVNSVTSTEEWFIENFVMNGKPKIRKIANLLSDIGLNYESSFFPGGQYAVRDRNLITSQNPFSGEPFIKLYQEALLDK